MDRSPRFHLSSPPRPPHHPQRRTEGRAGRDNLEGLRDCKTERLGSGRQNGFAHSPRWVPLDRRDPSNQRAGDPPGLASRSRTLPPAFLQGLQEPEKFSRETGLRASGPRRRTRWPPSEGAGSRGARWFPPTLQRALLFPESALGKDRPYPSLGPWRAQCLPGSLTPEPPLARPAEHWGGTETPGSTPELSWDVGRFPGAAGRAGADGWLVFRMVQIPMRCGGARAKTPPLPPPASLIVKETGP